jgi:UPF0755 protein
MPKLFRNLIILLTLALTVTGAWYFYLYYQKIYAPNVLLDSEKNHVMVKIPTGADFEWVTNNLIENNVIVDSAAFVWTAAMMEYNIHVLPGRYRIENGMSSRELVQLLRSGMQEPVMVRLPEVTYKEEIAGIFGRKLEADSSEIVRLMHDEDFLSQYNLNPFNVKSLFLADSYEFYWNTSAQSIFSRMHREFERFWTKTRREQAGNINMQPSEVITLASIVQKETYRFDEMPDIAGVYLNRLQRNMKLQADPTVLYAVNDPGIRRVLRKHLQTESPFNTYLHAGLPPGPIGVPSKRAIDAVLNASSHDYLYFCARADFSGYHDFSKTYREHLRCARRYQQTLSQMGIYQ